ncbi:hypothetical protein P280DRAFT_365341, partial [Massarina eburnea CBS 473.64]
MCTEWHYRFRRCGHTRLFRWEYCRGIPERRLNPATGAACPKHQMRYRDNQMDWNCFECMHERA